MTLCVAPHEIQDGDLMAFLDSEASTLVVDHLNRCPACQADTGDLAALAGEMGAALFRVACPPVDDLLAYQANLLGLGEQAQIRLHVQGCAHCQLELAELAAIPQSAAQAVTQAPVTLSDQLRRVGKRLMDAVLVTPPAQSALQLRGDEQTRLVYEAGGFRVILAKVPPMVAENIWQIEGQMMAESDAAQALLDRPGALAISLVAGDQAGGVVAEDVVDEVGFFFLEGVTAGLFTLRIETPDETIQIKDFKIP